MKVRVVFLWLLIFMAAAIWSSGPVVAAGGHIKGTIVLSLKNGKEVYGYRIRVFLVTEEIPVEPPSNLSQMEKMKKIDVLVSAHIDFFKGFQKKLTSPDYIASDTVSTTDGKFYFENIPLGNYYVLVTFPAMVHGLKVAWQHPVDIRNDQTSHVRLTNYNMVLPTYARNGQVDLE